MTTAKQIKEGCGRRIGYFGQNIKCGDVAILRKIYCPTCQAKLSQYKSDLQQELEWLEERYLEYFDRINFIKKELEEIEE